MRDSLYKKRGIYGIKNIDNEKVYVGKTIVNFGDRRDCHFSSLKNNKHFNNHLQNAWNKHGANQFVFIIIEELEGKEDYFNEREIYWIAYYKKINRTYNISNGGDGASGSPYIFTPARIALAEKNRVLNLGKKHSEETRKKMSNSQKGRRMSPEAIAKTAKANKGKIRTDEVKQRISKTLQLNPTRVTYDEETVLLIRYDLEYENFSYKEISEKYNISRKYITSIALYKRRAHLIPSKFLHDNSLPSQEEMLRNYRKAKNLGRFND